MVNIIVELSKYLMIVMIAVYTYECFAVFNFEDEYTKLHDRYKDLIKPLSIDTLSNEEAWDFHDFFYELDVDHVSGDNIYQFRQLASKDISDKENKYIYLKSRQIVRAYYLAHPNEKEEAFDYYDKVVASFANQDSPADNPMEWINENNVWAVAYTIEYDLDSSNNPDELKNYVEILKVTYEKGAGEVAAIRLGDCYYFGKGVEVDRAKAYDYYTSVSIKQNYRWKTILDDETLERPIEIAWSAYASSQYDKAYPLIKELVEIDNYNDSLIQYAYAYMNFNGLGCEKNEELAKKVYEENANLRNDVASMNNLGICYYEGKGVKQDYKKAYDWYKKSYDLSKDEYNCYNLGLCYYHGNGVTKDYNQAFYYFSQNENKNHEGTYEYLGYCYRYGYGTEKDNEKAFHFLCKAHEVFNNEKIKYELALCYYNGIGTDDKEKAFELFSELALNNYAPSYQYVALCYYFGYGIEKDLSLSFDWMEQANTYHQTKSSLFNMGLYYELGYGTEINIDKAIDYYNKAAMKGHKKAVERLTKLAKKY